MIAFNNSATLSYMGMGLFDTESVWTHPKRVIDSYELIYVTEGKICIREEKNIYSFRKGEMLLLEPNLEHAGTEISTGHTSFFWLHFCTNDLPFFGIPKLCAPAAPNTERSFKEIMHFSKSNLLLCELTLAKFLLSLNTSTEYRNKIAFEANEYIRILSSRPLTARAVASHFGYSTDYLSRIYKKEFGMDLKAGIIKHRISYIESVLINTNDSIKEIAANCGFEEENLFVKFFKYHEGITPTQYRNKFFYIHMNNK